jgi:hypothetical protein
MAHNLPETLGPRVSAASVGCRGLQFLQAAVVWPGTVFPRSNAALE